ncbi:MAG: citrate synthase [Proteobacteria bacterium]|nr:citrate synthase [Pseudomonadota bacterium]MBU1708799.1 citrate synthase [Pseudomonadota bacterium]
MSEQHSKVKLRDEKFVSRASTRIWEELPSDKNPYLAESCRCHGYDIIELARKKSFVDVLFLLFRGELPTREQSELLEIMMITMINPGPRHPATWAAMNTGVGKTFPEHILPIALSAMGGAHLGGVEVSEAMRFFNKHIGKDAGQLVDELIEMAKEYDGDTHIAPGFGSRFSGIDPMPQKYATMLSSLPGSGEALKWGISFAEALKSHNMGWLATGVAAAVFCDLGFTFSAGTGIFQLISAPGMLAHGLELSGPFKPITAMPFLDGEHYVIDEQAKTKKR